MPFRRLNSREVYRNPWVTVEVHDIEHPTGARGEHVVIVTPAASAVVVDDDGDLIFARQARYAIGADVLEIVKGGAAEGETPLDCAKRELREELGLVAASWVSLGDVYEIPSIVQNPVSLFLARGIEHTVDDQENAENVAGDPENVEQIELVRVQASQALAAAVAGRITDAVTLAALLRYRSLTADSLVPEA